ncbi:MAG TPA: VWA domain-containing protein, partial [Pirellulales bacterium]|nr:VWA domain-containing protein [Pirellulales bacterium]
MAWLLSVGACLQEGAVDRVGGEETGSRAPAAAVETYARADGQTYFALKLSPHLPQPKTRPSDVVVLFDTSASQVGAYRAKALDALRAMLAQLSADDRVALVAVDVNAARLTQAWGPPQGNDIRQALVALERRVPLGSTDMRAALDAALGTWQAAADARRTKSVVYIGDGFSTANLVSIETLDRLVRQFVERRISVSSYAIGPRLNGELLGALANHTGGMLVADHDRASDRQFGSYLATVARAAVVWPTATDLPAAMRNVY